MLSQSKLGAFLLVCVALISMGCTRVEPGNVGVVVNMYGSNRGVDDIVVKTGRVWYNPYTEDIYEFPTYTQNAMWSMEDTDDSPGDQSITFNSVEGAIVNADVAVAYQILPEYVPQIFVELRKDADYIKSVYVRSKVRDSFSRHASTMKVVDIFGAKKQELLLSVKEDIENGMPGFKFDMISFVGGLRVDKLVEESINMTIQATQRAIEAENKVKQSEAEANQKVAEAKGTAESIMLEAKAKADANTLLTESLSEPLLRYEALQRWDGILPKVTGDAIPFLNIESELN